MMNDADAARIINQEIIDMADERGSDYSGVRALRFAIMRMAECKFLVSEIDKEIAAAEDRMQKDSYPSNHLLYEDMGFIKGTSRILKSYKEFLEDMIRGS